MKVLNSDDIESVEREADRFFFNWNRPAVRGQMLMPQDSLHYWMAIATQKYIAEKLEIEITE